MCKISDHLKLCTCKKKDVENLQHYWILYKYQKREIFLVGETIPPQKFDIGIENDAYNFIRLAAMLNEGNCFDIDLTPGFRDILQFNFTYHSNPEAGNKKKSLVYEFIYKKNKWMPNNYNSFNSNKMQKNQGKIIHPFEQSH